MALPRRIPKKRNRSLRWRSAAHCNFVRRHECCVPGCDQRPIEVAHLREGTDAGVGRKSSDWFTVSLCIYHHRLGPKPQHNLGETTFGKLHGIDLHALADEFAKASPKSFEIAQVKRERGL